MATQIQHNPGSLPILGADEGGALEPPDSSGHSIADNNNNSSSSSSNNNQDITIPNEVNNRSFSHTHSLPPSPAHLILTHNNGPHVSLVPTLSAPPASAAIVPNRFRKLSFSDNHPIVPSPLHTEIAHAPDDGGLTPSTTPAPSHHSHPSSAISSQLSLLNLEAVKHAVEDDDDDDDESNTTPTSSIYTASEAAESELSRTSYESSVLAPISEAPDSSFSSSSTSDPDPDTTPSLNTPKTTPISFQATPPKNCDHQQPRSDRKGNPTLKITGDGSDRVSALDDDAADDDETATPTSSIIRSRSDSVMASATSTDLAAEGRGRSSLPAVNGTGAQSSEPSPSSSAGQATAPAAQTPVNTTTNLTRSGSGRRLSCPTKASSPAASATKTKLRPCFRRRSSAQSTSALSTTSSSDIDDGLHPHAHHVRGRSVRFSPGPPQEVRTHSPVEYDRKSCTVNHRLTMEDVEEMRKMQMGLGLLEAKWAAAAACKAAAASASAPSSTAAAAVTSPSKAHASLYANDDDDDSPPRDGCEAEIKFHSAAGVAGMRRSQRPSWEREQEWDGYDRDRGDRRWDRERTPDSRIRVDGSGPLLTAHHHHHHHHHPRLGLTRQYSAGGTSGADRLAPPLGSSGLARRGTVTRTNAAASVYNRADYSDSSESEYEMPYSAAGSSASSSSLRARGGGGGGGFAASSASRDLAARGVGSAAAAAASHSLLSWSAPTTSAPAMSSNLSSPCSATEGGGSGGGAGGGCGLGWQPPDRCRNGYSGGWPGQHAASRRGGSSTTSGPGGSVGMSASCSLPSAFIGAGTNGDRFCGSAAAATAAAPATAPATATTTNSIIARFGLNSPPPPLPGGVASATATDHHHPHQHHPAGWGSGSLSNHSSPGTGVGGGYASGGYVSHCGRRSPLILPPSSSSSRPSHGGRSANPESSPPIPSFKRTPPEMEDQNRPAASSSSGSPPTPSKTSVHSSHPTAAAAAGAADVLVGDGGETKLSSDSASSKWIRDLDRSSPISSTLSSSSCAGSASGYDSPASEFCYESGSEYDLVG